MYQNNECTSHDNNEVEPVQLVQMNIYQSNTYRQDLRWLHFYNDLLCSREAASVGPTVMHTRFCNLPSIFKWQLGVPGQT